MHRFLNVEIKTVIKIEMCTVSFERKWLLQIYSQNSIMLQKL